MAALSLPATVAAERGDLAEADASSTTAVELLEAAGTLPALRTEEIFLVHARVLEREADPSAAQWYQRAAEVLDAKAASIGDAARRQQYLDRGPVSRAIRRRS